MEFHLHRVKTCRSKQYVVKVTDTYDRTVRNPRELEPQNSRRKLGCGHGWRRNTGAIKGIGIPIS